MTGLDKDQIAAFEEQGFLFLPGFFSAAETAVLREGAARAMARTGPELVREEGLEAVRLVYGAHRYDAAFERLGRHPFLIGAAAQLLGADGVYIHQSRLNPKAAFSGGEWAWHQDFATWHDRDGLLAPRALMVAVFIEEVTAANAPLLIVPGSHKSGLVHEANDNRDSGGYSLFTIPPETLARLAEGPGITAVTGPAGSVLISHCNIVHGSANNITPWPRTIFYLNVAACDNPPTKFDRAEHHCTRDWSAIQPLGPDCLRELAG
jgi:ectoine hydroxylase